MPPIVPDGAVVWGIQLPVQSQSRLYVEDWELSAGPPEVLTAARAAERAGAFYVAVCDHVAIPDDLAPRMGAQWWDTVATLGWLAGQTTTVRLLSSVWNINYRNPLLTAKHFATLDLLSGGRVILGVGAGHVAKEFAALGVPFEGRGAITDETLRAVSDVLESGRYCDLQIEPRAVQRPRPPIWVGGSAGAAARRAARHGDGWLPQATPLREMPALVELFRAEREAAGREGGDIGAITGWVKVGEPSWEGERPMLSGSPERIAEKLRRWTAVGVNHIQVRFPSRSADELCEQIERFGAEVAPLLH